jgi:hypothetical protein
MNRSHILSIVLIGILVMAMFLRTGVEAAPPNQALNRLLQGQYAFSGEASCLVSIGGFNADLTPVASGPFPFVVSFAVQGVRTFNGDGTGTLVARVVSFTHPFALPTSPTPVFNRGGAASNDISAAFTYQVAPDRTFTVLQPLANGTFLTGTRAGQTFTDGPFSLMGEISSDGQTLTSATDQPTVETITFSNGDVQRRICHRSRIHFTVR